jgi:hypothetical protein
MAAAASAAALDSLKRRPFIPRDAFEVPCLGSPTAFPFYFKLLAPLGKVSLRKASIFDFNTSPKTQSSSRTVVTLRFYFPTALLGHSRSGSFGFSDVCPCAPTGEFPRGAAAVGGGRARGGSTDRSTFRKVHAAGA